jgi:hypothetical protein
MVCDRIDFLDLNSQLWLNVLVIIIIKESWGDGREGKESWGDGREGKESWGDIKK